MDLHHLRCFLVLAEELSFGRAAERLAMSQPPLTRLIAGMEREIGAKLFDRTTRRVALTPVGEVMAVEARSVLERMEEALLAVDEAVARASGRLRIAYMPLALYTVLPGILARLRERFHDVSVDLLEMHGGAQEEALRKGRVDIGFTDGPVTGGDLEGRLVHREAFGVVMAEGGRLASRRPVTLRALAGETFILHPRREYPAYYDRVVGACEAAGFTPKIRHRGVGENCMALVAAGAGVLLAPESYRRAPGSRYLPLAPSSRLFSEVWMVWRDDDDSRYVRSVVGSG